MHALLITAGKGDGMSGYFEGFDVNKDEKVTLEEVRRFLLENSWLHYLLLNSSVFGLLCKKGSRRWC